MNGIDWLECFVMLYENHPLDPNNPILRDKPVNNHEDTALILACKIDKLEAIKLLIKNKADVNIKNIYNETALYWAIMNRSIEIIHMLFQIDYMKISFNKTLELAYDMNWFEMFELLLRKGANMVNDKFINAILNNADFSSGKNNPDPNNYLEYTQPQNDETTDDEELDRQAHLESEYRALVIIEKESKLHYLKSILMSGCNLNGKIMHKILMTFNNDLIGCMMDNLPNLMGNNCCAYYYEFYKATGRLDVLDRFIQNGANINYYGDYLPNLVSFALSESDIEFVELLCNKNHNINFNEVLLCITYRYSGAKTKSKKVIDYVLSKITNLNYMNRISVWDTALVHACKCEDQEYLIFRLLEMGADPNIYKHKSAITYIYRQKEKEKLNIAVSMIINGLDTSKALIDIFARESIAKIDIKVVKLLLQYDIKKEIINRSIIHLINTISTYMDRSSYADDQWIHVKPLNKLLLTLIKRTDNAYNVGIPLIAKLRAKSFKYDPYTTFLTKLEKILFIYGTNNNEITDQCFECRIDLTVTYTDRCMNCAFDSNNNKNKIIIY